MHASDTASETDKAPAASGNLPVPAAQAVLQITGGVHEGVALPLAKSVYSIGSRPPVDILLGDSGIAPEHGVVRLHNGSAVVEAAGGEIGIGRRHRLAQGRGCRVKLPVELRLGEAVLIIKNLSAGARTGARATSRVALLGAGCTAALLLASVFGTDAGVRLTAAAGQAMSAVPSVAAPSAPVAAAPAPNQPMLASAAAPPSSDPPADSLAAKLREAGLPDITIKAEGTRIVALGAIAAEDRATWSDVQRWFDRAYAGRYVLASAVETRAPFAKPKFDLQAISFNSESPYVITADGQRRYPGAVLDKGWIIKDIRAGNLVLTKDGREFILNF